ncbi:MAG TPA: hypothetical protein ENN29_00430 [Candidatus Hydrogenedentes bacterium]|mgnify:CR=1 FL=1|nr:hypothetical protein [Candidatus Hydrogenedentota bacterium]
MKKIVLLNGLVMVLFAALVTGCATGGSGLSDEEMVRLQLDQWSQGLIEQDMDKFLATISENFTARQAPDKETLAGFIEQAIEAGYLDEAEVSLEDAQFTIVDGVCSVYPVDLMSIAGSVAVELTFTKEDGKWLVTGMDVDGL